MTEQSSNSSTEQIAAITSNANSKDTTNATGTITLPARPEAFDEITEPAQHAAEAETAYPTGFKFNIIFISLAMILVLGALDATVVATAVPSITDYFHTVSDVGWYSVAFRLPTCACQLIFGKLYKIFSVKRLMLGSVLVFLVGSVLCASAVSSKMFIFGRAVTGFAAASIIAGAFTLLVQILPLRKRPLYTSIFGAIECIAVVCSPVLGGVLTEKLSWRWCFWINLPLGVPPILTMAIFFTDVKEPEAKSMSWKQIVKQLDLLGTAAFVPAITLFFLALTWAGTKYPFDSPIVISLYAAFAVLLGLFIWDQHRKQDEATLPPRIFKQRDIVAGFIFTLCCNGANNAIEYYMPTYFQIVRGYTPGKSGYLMIPLVVGFTVGMLAGGSGTSLIGYYNPFLLTGSILMPLATGLMTTWSLDSSLAKLIGCSLFNGFAVAIGFQAPQSAVQTVLTDSDGPLGLSVILFAQNFGPALSISLAQTIFENRLAVNLKEILPGLSAKGVSEMGLGQLVAMGAQEGKLEQVRRGVDRSVVEMWYFPVGLTCVSVVGSLMMGWRSVKEKKN